jgi:putative transposase
MVDYIDSQKDEFGIEPIWATLQVAPSTYYAAKARLPSARALRDAVLLPLIMTLWVANYRVYGFGSTRCGRRWSVMTRPSGATRSDA